MQQMSPTGLELVTLMYVAGLLTPRPFRHPYN